MASCLVPLHSNHSTLLAPIVIEPIAHARVCGASPASLRLLASPMMFSLLGTQRPLCFRTRGNEVFISVAAVADKDLDAAFHALSRSPSQFRLRARPVLSPTARSIGAQCRVGARAVANRQPPQSPLSGRLPCQSSTQYRRGRSPRNGDARRETAAPADHVESASCRSSAS